MQAARERYDVVIVDTAGRLQIDDRMMAELKATQRAIKPSDTLLVVDAMTGQEAASLTKAFNEAAEITGTSSVPSKRGIRHMGKLNPTFSKLSVALYLCILLLHCKTTMLLAWRLSAEQSTLPHQCACSLYTGACKWPDHVA